MDAQQEQLHAEEQSNQSQAFVARRGNRRIRRGNSCDGFLGSTVRTPFGLGKIFGENVSKREREALEKIMGYFLQQLVLHLCT